MHESTLQVLYDLAIDKSNNPIRWSKTDEWQNIGFGGSDPRTDFRTGGLFSLLNLVYFAKYYPKHFNHMNEQTAYIKDKHN